MPFGLAQVIPYGRDHTNPPVLVSEWDGGEELHELREAINEGEMPLWDYRIFYPVVCLSVAGKAALVDGLIFTITRSSP